MALPEVGTWGSQGRSCDCDQTSKEKTAALGVWGSRHDVVGKRGGVRGQGNKSISDEGPAKQRHG